MNIDTSNFPHESPFVIQGKSSFGWQDSKHGGQTIEEAQELFDTLPNDPKTWAYIEAL